MALAREGRGSSRSANPDQPVEMCYAEVPGVDPSLTSMDVYHDGSHSSRPIIIHVHGGGWKEGDKAGSRTRARAFLRAGFVFISANYRLHPQAWFPAHVEDLAAATAFARDTADSIGGDPSRIFVLGTSAGAHITSLLATDGRFMKSVGMSPADLSGVISIDTRAYDIPLLMEMLPRGGGRLYRDVFGSNRRFWAKASPVSHIRPEAGIPPFFIAYSGGDPNREQQSRRFAQRLGAAGVRAWLVPATDKSHIGICQDISKDGDPVTLGILEFLSSV